MQKPQKTEPTFEQACSWWPDLENIWTTLGWRDHTCRFNVLWNGTVLAAPDLNGRTWTPFGGKGAMLSFNTNQHDNNLFDQGWHGGPAPVLWTRWPTDAVTIQTDTFVHTPGGGELARGDEPLFAWVRLGIADLCQGTTPDEEWTFVATIHGKQVTTSMMRRHNVQYQQWRCAYPRALKLETCGSEGGWRIVEPDGLVRLAIAPCRNAKVAFEAYEAKLRDAQPQTCYKIKITVPWRRGQCVDMVLPMVPTDRAVCDAEVALGRKAALAEVARFWSGQLSRTKTVFSVPEKPVSEMLDRSRQFSHVLTEKDVPTGRYCKVIGSWTYSNLWTTPGAMDLVMLMDCFGYHDFVGRYLDVFRLEQGTVKPPGDAMQLHPGYLSTPERFKSIDWLTDNGAVLYALAMHGLLSSDHAYIERFTDTIVKSCEFIRDARAIADHGGCEGILPPAVATDSQTKIQAVWSDGWNYLGLCKAVNLLTRIGHARADEFRAEARAYREAFRKAFFAKLAEMPRWTDRRGKKRVLAPTAMSGERKSENRHPFYLDGGPLFAVFAGLLDADEPAMRDLCEWFGGGPPTRMFRRESDFSQMPVLVHEMSSVEPCYSWNVFHTHQLGDREKFLEGMYSLLAGSLSRKTYTSCETRGGITGLVCSATLAAMVARLAVVDDQLKADELHLLRMMPLAWLVPGKEAAFVNMPTEFGPVSVTAKLSRDGKGLDINYTAELRYQPKRVVLHIPPVAGLRKVVMNGKALSAGKKMIVVRKGQPLLRGLHASTA